MVMGLDCGSSSLGSIPGQGHCVLFCNTFNSHSAKLERGVEMLLVAYAVNIETEDKQ